MIRVASQLGPHGRLYEVDARLRPTGRSGALAVSIDAFARYFAEGAAQLWERQALCKARVVIGTEAAAETRWRRWTRPRSARRGNPSSPPRFARCAAAGRNRFARAISSAALGGTVDTEFLVQMLQLKHGGSDPSVRVPGTLDALTALERAAIWRPTTRSIFRRAIAFSAASRPGSA